MEIRRDLYLNRLIRRKHNGLIKVITGMRRCGKSFLLFRLFKRHLLECGVPETHIIDIAFDAYENAPLRNPTALLEALNSRLTDSDPYYVLLDEVQLLDSFADVLNSLIRRPNIDVYVTGSNARFLSKDVITEFRGRGDPIHMHPLSFAEFMSVYDGERQSGWNEYLLYGGLPLILSFTEPEDKSNYLKFLFRETYLSDIVNRHSIRHREEFENLIRILASGIGALTNPAKLSATFKSVKKKTLSPVTIKNYIDYLEDAFVLTGARRFDIKGKKYINTPLKYYFSDSGLRNALLNFRQIEETHSLENIVFNELIMRGYNVDVGLIEQAERNKKGEYSRNRLEIDFVCNQGSERYYIQVAYSLLTPEKKHQEERPLLLLRDGFKRIMITKNFPAPHYNDRGVLFMDLFDFLLDSDSLRR